MEKFFKLPLRKNGTKGFSLAEISVVLVILGVVTAIVARFAFTTPQKQFDAKFNKISADISSNIAKGISSKTGFRFSNYRNDNDSFVADITNNLKGSTTSIADDWSNNVSPDGADISNYTAYKMDNEAVLAIDNNGTDIYIDVNGKKGPNTLGRDIYKYQSTYENQQDMLANVNLALDDSVCVDPGEPVIPHATAFSYDAATCQYSLSSCEGNWTKSGDSCVCNLARIKQTGRLAQNLNTASCTYGASYCYSFDTINENATQLYKNNSNILATANTETTQKGDISNNCVNKTKTTYTYSCKTTTDSGQNTSYKTNSRITENKTAASPANNCINTYTYTCNSTINSGKNDTYASKQNITETKVDAAPENGCVNTYTYACNSSTTAGYDKDIAKLIDQDKEKTRIETTITEAKPANDCVQTYSYKCKSTINQNYDKNKSTNSNFKEEITKAAPANNCINTYKYTCKLAATKTEGRIKYTLNSAKCAYDNGVCTSYDTSKRDTAKVNSGNYTETVTNGTVSNGCVNSYSYTCKLAATKTEGRIKYTLNSAKCQYDSGVCASYDTSKRDTAKANSGNYTETVTNGTVSNNCVNSYKYTCKLPATKTEGRIKYTLNSAKCEYDGGVCASYDNQCYNTTKVNSGKYTVTVTNGTVANGCRNICTYTCKLAATKTSGRVKYTLNSAICDYDGGVCTSYDTSRRDTAKANSGKYTETVTNGTVSNGCVNSYSYTCKLAATKTNGRIQYTLNSAICDYDDGVCTSYDTQGYNETYHKAPKKYTETLTSGTPANGCVNTYKYTCVKTTDKDRKTKLESYSRVKTNVINGTPDNGCKNVYSYTCASTVTTGPDETLRAKSMVKETFVAAEPSNNCENHYKYTCKTTTTEKVTHYSKKGTIVQVAAPSNNCVTKISKDPMILDLNGDGFKFTSDEDGTNFDLDGDGNIDKTAWTAKQDKFDDAFLVLDKNGNGQIDDGLEMFGDQDGEENGFLELAKYDDNKDGVIDKNDSVYNNLKLWADMNANGKVDEGEIKSLNEMKVTEISTNYHTNYDADGNRIQDEHGNDVSITGFFKQIVEEIKDGISSFFEKIGDIVDAFFTMISGGES